MGSPVQNRKPRSYFLVSCPFSDMTNFEEHSYTSGGGLLARGWLALADDMGSC